MVRISKQSERRNTCPKRPQPPVSKTGPLKETRSFGVHENAITGALSSSCFIPKIK